MTNQTPESSQDKSKRKPSVLSEEGLRIPLTMTRVESSDPERSVDEELWQVSVWVKPGRSSEVFEQISKLDGVAGLYRAWQSSAE